jgi:hypothetical protein
MCAFTSLGKSHKIYGYEAVYHFSDSLSDRNYDAGYAFSVKSKEHNA